MSRISRYQDLSVYNAYNRPQSTPLKKAEAPAIESSGFQTNNVKVDISNAGIDALKVQRNKPQAIEQSTDKQEKNTSQISYKNKLATSQYKANTQFYNENS